MADAPPLPPAPRRIADLQGRPRLGKFAGAPDRVEPVLLASRHRPPLHARALREKRWVFAGLATDEVLVGLAAVDLGFAAHGFLYVAEPARGSVLFEAAALGPPRLAARVGDRPDLGLSAGFHWGGLELAARRLADAPALRVEARGRGGLRLAARFEVAGVEPLTVIAPVGPVVPGEKKGDPPRFGRVQTTVKRAGVPVEGRLEVAGRSFALAGGLGGVDFSLGEPDRDTAWRWAMGSGRGADGRAYGFNFVEGFNEGPGIDESALWLDGRLVGLPPVRFHREGDGEPARFTVRSACGGVELGFTAFHVHREERETGPVASRFHQYLGRFDGRLGELPVAGCVGVLEDQKVRW